MNVLVTTVPFSETNQLPIELLECNNINYIINPYGKKLTEDQICELVSNIDVIIAGTEPITKKVIDSAPHLKLISRVGIGLDSVDLNYAKAKGIKVCYTPDAPAPAVAELTIGLMLNLIRSIHLSNTELHNGIWKRHFGRRIPELTIGIIGVGRIGGRVIRRLSAFGSPRILVNDILPNPTITNNLKLEWVDKKTILKESDIVSLHLPLTKDTFNSITSRELSLMKNDAMIINVSRGGIINELDLYNSLSCNEISGAAIDVFEQEPYTGKLATLDNCILTAHMGSMSLDCRVRMEIEATEEVIRFKNGFPLKSSVPDSEYKIQSLINI